MVLLYDLTSNLEQVNQAHKQLFTQKGRAIDGFPPTQAALIQHTKRAAYQAGHCWAQMMVTALELQSPGDWGCKRKDKDGWEVHWTTLLQKRPRHVTNSSTVDLKRGAEDSTNVPKQHFTALPLATMVACVLGTNNALH